MSSTVHLPLEYVYQQLLLLTQPTSDASLRNVTQFPEVKEHHSKTHTGIDIEKFVFHSQKIKS